MAKQTVLMTIMATMLAAAAWSQERPDGGGNGAVATAEQVKRYIAQYDGGQCFLVRLLSFGDGRAAIEGRGTSVAPFMALDAAIKRDLGFEAQIAVRLVSESQCPEIDRLKQQGGENNPP
jgi:serine/threonine-protein kinase